MVARPAFAALANPSPVEMDLVPVEIAPLPVQKRPVAAGQRAAMFKSRGSPDLIARRRQRLARRQDNIELSRSIPTHAAEAFEKVVSRQARALVIIEARQFRLTCAPVRATDRFPVVYFVPCPLERFARHGAALDLPVRLRVLPIPADQDDGICAERDEILLGLEIPAPQAELPRGRTLANKNPSALDLLALGADGHFCPRDLEQVVLQLQRRQSRRRGGPLGDNDGAGGRALLHERERLPRCKLFLSAGKPKGR